MLGFVDGVDLELEELEVPESIGLHARMFLGLHRGDTSLNNFLLFSTCSMEVLCMNTNNQEHKGNEEECGDESEQLEDEHHPEWTRIFDEIKEEADRAYPDGRVRIIVPKRRRRSRKRS